MVLPGHVLEEIERDLPRRARPDDDVELAYRRLRTLYLPRAAAWTTRLACRQRTHRSAEEMGF